MHTLPSFPALDAPADGLAYVRGAADVPLSESTVGQFLRETARRFSDQQAVVFREQLLRWTWKEFDDHVDQLAAGFLSLGIEKGDRVGIWSPNRFEWLLTQFATARIGAVLVNINPAYRVAELEYALQKVKCKALVTAESFKTSNYISMLLDVAPELASQQSDELRAARLPDLRTVISVGDWHVSGVMSFHAVMQRGEGVLRDKGREVIDTVEQTLSSHDPINIQFTSGTTGSPKGATLTHRNIVNNGRFVAMAMKLSDADSLCIPVPLYHCFGMVLGVLACVSVGAQMVFPGEGFDAGATLAAVSEERCTALHGVPTMFIAELGHPEFSSFDLSSLRTGIMAGSPCPVETMNQVVTNMHMREVTIAYGMTETSPVSFQSATADPLDKRTTTVGRIQPHLEVKIVDFDGKTVSVGETGELCTRGYSVMLGYWEDETKTRESIVDGWMHTGDLATIDADGYCNIVGRLKDMVIRGGENIYPREVEEYLFRHPKIQNVQVFGVPDEKNGEELCAWIVLRKGEVSTEEDIRDFCRGQIAHYKVPKYIRFVNELPMTVTGKVQKFAMREEMIRYLNLTEHKTA
ncbi:AMP-binding protein [Paraburkholderia haematera]|uniref:3-[(3aS,4S,7aS)-7a-methyl-1, 5-dioxo-octahydro-1H-inden-4-yl]propanoyl:CoA ligase n=1 Tax=Paraburkholderia haematera TaxID=2793077 RepID=A0ABM8SVG9_9BURK|nr:AMP-binding protein [Paraburkholderia haematera]CAE6836137.1 3-[(3aS,4S,7aS)-7a-methyl-1, 5-dioxo-octahydro-1H-inden-4-yl]propanoyl:CoA ligase [Paraburkholderia haematera]